MNEADPRTPGSGPDTDLRAGLIGAAIAVSAWGGGSVLAKLISMDGMAIAVYRFTLFSILMMAWLRSRGITISARVMRHSFWGGLALGLDVALFFSAVKLTNVVNATLIGSLQPVFVGVVAARFYGEKIKRRDVMWSAVAIGGVILVVLASNSTPQWSATGDLLALGAMLSWGCYFIASKNSKEHLTPTEFTTGSSIWTALINVPLAFAFGQDLSWPSNRDWFWLLVMTALAGFVGHTMMNWSLVRIPLWVGSTFTLLIPVASSLIAWAALDEALSLGQVVPMALVLGALAMIVVNQSTPGEPTTTEANPVEAT